MQRPRREGLFPCFRAFALFSLSPSLSFFMRGFAPARRGSFGFAPLRSGQALLFRQKDPKPLAPGRGPRGVPLPRFRLFGLRNSLRSDSPRLKIEFAGPGRSHARRRKDRTFACIVMPDILHRASSVFVFCLLTQYQTEAHEERKELGGIRCRRYNDYVASSPDRSDGAGPLFISTRSLKEARRWTRTLS